MTGSQAGFILTVLSFNEDQGPTAAVAAGKG